MPDVRGIIDACEMSKRAVLVPYEYRVDFMKALRKDDTLIDPARTVVIIDPARHDDANEAKLTRAQLPDGLDACISAATEACRCARGASPFCTPQHRVKGAPPPCTPQQRVRGAPPPCTPQQRESNRESPFDGGGGGNPPWGEGGNPPNTCPSGG